MTLEIYSSPGVETYRSTKFTTTVETVGGIAQTPYTYGVSEVSTLNVSHLWTNGSAPEMSWITYGSSETTVVRVSLTSGSITSATIYPKQYNIEYEITGGVLIITVPSHKKLWVEVNGDRAEPLFIFADELKPAIPGGYVTFTPGTTSVTAGATMYFPPGVHNIGQKFKVNTGSTVYLDGGAWLIGSFDVYDRGDVTITGPGVLSGESIAWADVQALGDWQSQMEYCMIYAGSVGIRSAHVRNNLKRITIVNAPWYNQTYGINYISDVKIIGPWHQNTDGFSPELDASNGSISSVTDCFSYTGDDNMKAIQSSGNHTVSGCFMINSASACIRFGFWPWPPDGFNTVVNDNYIYAIQKYYGSHAGATEGSEIIACQVDGEAGEEAWGRFNVTIDNLYVEGSSIQAPLFSIKNRLYPWGAQALAYGQISNWTISNIYVESTPTVLSQLIGLDSTNTPHDITFTNIIINNVGLTESNWSSYVTENAYPYNITISDVSGIIDLSAPIDIVTYVTYYTIIVSSNLRITLQSAVDSSSFIKLPQYFTTSGIIVRPIPGYNSFSYLKTITVRVYSSLNQSIILPSISQNTRSGDTSLNRIQTISTRSASSKERSDIINIYEEAGTSLDGMSNSNKQIFARIVTSNVASSKDTKLILSSLTNNYGRGRR